MYRGITYDYSKSNIKLFTWDKEGKRITRDFHYKPYFFTETSNKTEYKSIFNGYLKKHEFDNDFERRKSIKTSGNERIYGNLPVEQQFLIDAFWDSCKKNGFSQYYLSYFYIDIEVFSPDEFPDSWDANHPVNVITIFNSLKNEFRVICLDKLFNPNNLDDENRKRYEKINSSFEITHHSNEKELLKAFLNYWKKDYPDIITGWNLPFDIPYLVNRIKKKLSNKDVLRLSPIGKVREIDRNQKMNAQFSQTVKDYLIYGVTTLDYHDVYMKFNMKPVPNRKLDTILNKELGIGKVKYESSNLAKLSQDDWDLFVFYNIEDVNGLKLLEEKLKFLQTCRTISYMGLVPMKKALDTIPIINGYSAINALEEGKIIPTFDKNRNWRNFDGAYVKEPVPGLYDNVVSFDLNSLYPMTIITLNMSPETKFGRVRYDGKDVIVEDNVGKETRMTKEKFDLLMEKTKMAISKSNILFTQNKKGIFPKLVEEVYSNRVEVKKQLNSLRKKHKFDENNYEIERLEAYQNALKVVINSLYGYTGNQYAQMSDIDIAESVTMTCQNVIKKSGDFLERIIGDFTHNYDEKTLVYQDTDSVSENSVITTNMGKMEIRELFDNILKENFNNMFEYNGYQIIPSKGIECCYSDGFDIKMGNIRNIIRHRVTKKKYKIRYNDKEVYITEDHGLMVQRNGYIKEIKPSEFQKGDKIYLLM